MAKREADVETVKAAYAAAQEPNRRNRVHVLAAIDLAEEITGQRFRGDSFNGRSRQSEARKVIDWPELERSITELLADGWLRQVAAVLALVLRGLRRAGVPAAELDAFAAEATSGNYDHLLQTAMAWVEVE